MATYDALKARGNATACFWVEISGMPWVVSDGVVTAALFTGDGYTENMTFIPALQQPGGAFSRSIELVPGNSSVGGFSLTFNDIATGDLAGIADAQPDGFFTWLFGADRSTISVQTLTADVDPDDTTWTVTPGFGGATTDAIGYCELETIRYDVAAETPTTLSNVERAMWHSPAVAHRANQWDVFPIITSHPTQWAGRIVTFFQTYYDGQLASSDGTTATARAEAHKWRGVLRDVTFRDGAWTIRCDSLDTLLKRQICRGQVSLPVSPRVYVSEAFIDQDVAADGIVALITLGNPAAWGPVHFRIEITPGWYSRDSFLQAVNAALPVAATLDTDGNATWQGSLSVAFGGDEFVWSYTTDAGAGNERTCMVDVDRPIFSVYRNREASTVFYWETFGQLPEDRAYRIMPNDLEAPANSTTYTNTFPATSDVVLDLDLSVGNFIVACNGNEAGDTVGDFATDDAVAIVSQAGVSACRVISADAANSVMRLEPLLVVKQQQVITHTGTRDDPIIVRHAVFAYGGQVEGLDENALCHSTMEILLSSGLAAFNDLNFDTLREGLGIAIPYRSPMAGTDNSERLLNRTSFTDFFWEAEAFGVRIVDFIHEPTDALEWLRQRVGFLGGYLAVRDGQICIQRVEALFSSSDAVLTEDELQGQGTITLGEAHTITSVKYEHNWSLESSKFMTVTDVVRGNKTASEAENVVRYSDKGIIVTDPLRLEWLGHNALYAFAKENWIYELVSDRVHWDIEPGDVIRFSDEGDSDSTDDARRYHGLPNPDGTRGYGSGSTATRLLVIGATTDLDAGTTQIKAVNLRGRHTGYSPAAWVESFTNVVNAVLTCTSQFFSPTADGVDVSRFTVGDKVRVLSVNPTQAGADPGLETGEAGFTIQSIDTAASTITLTGTLSLAWPSPPAAASQCMVVVHDDYETASQTADAQAWAWSGDSSGDIDDGGDDCYQW